MSFLIFKPHYTTGEIVRNEAARSTLHEQKVKSGVAVRFTQIAPQDKQRIQAFVDKAPPAFESTSQQAIP